MTQELTISKSGSITPQTFTEMMQFAELLSKSNLIPNQYKGRAGDIIAAIQLGSEIGLKPFQALQSIAVINGRPCIYGDGSIALVRASGLVEDFEEKQIGKEGTDSFGYLCKAKRKGNNTFIEHTFTIADAKQAGLWGKTGPWTQYPKRMLQFRARSWVLRDGFADVLKGLSIAEEAIDIEPIPEPDKATISIEDFKPSEEQPELPPETDSEPQKETEPDNSPKVSLDELRSRIRKACMFLGDNDIETATLVYHGFADIVKIKEEIDKDGNKVIGPSEKQIAKAIGEISIAQARTVWGKIKKHLKEKKLDIEEKLDIIQEEHNDK